MHVVLKPMLISLVCKHHLVALGASYHKLSRITPSQSVGSTCLVICISASTSRALAAFREPCLDDRLIATPTAFSFCSLMSMQRNSVELNSNNDGRSPVYPGALPSLERGQLALFCNAVVAPLFDTASRFGANLERSFRSVNYVLVSLVELELCT